MKNIINEITKLLNDCSIDELLSVNFISNSVLEEKLYNIIDENGGEYIFNFPKKMMIPLDMLTKQTIKHTMEIKSILGEKEDINKEESIYTFTIKAIDDTTITIPYYYGIDNSLMHSIIESITNEEKYKEKLKRSKSIFFNNEDIIITDPCYIRKRNPFEYPKYETYGVIGNKPFDDYTDEDKKNLEKYNNDPYFIWEKENRDWEDSDYGENMEVLGIKNYLTRSTIYGDWSCTTYNSDTKEPIGEFCADAGLVSVFSLNEVRNYNPDIDEWIKEHKWCVTTIENFTGEVYIDVEKEEGVYQDTTKYHKEGEKWEEYSVHVIGKGTTNFITSQTGL